MQEINDVMSNEARNAKLIFFSEAHDVHHRKRKLKLALASFLFLWVQHYSNLVKS
jgi:hypothetical protein